jgi:hypothetical protein
MKKFLVIGLVAMLFGVGAVSCGNDAGFEAIITLPDDIDFGSVVNGQGVTTTGPVLIKVQKSTDDTTPVPDANITIFAGGIGIDNLTPIMYTDALLLNIAGNGFTWKTKTDDAGTVRVFPAVVTDCGAVTTNIAGNVNLQVVIAADSQTWTGTFSLTCS